MRKLVCVAGIFSLAAAAQGMAPASDFELTDQHGRQVHFYRDLVVGHTVAVNFIFTSCNTVCPVLGANFAKVERLLGNRAGSEIRLISISVDPVTDTPERLLEFATKFGGKQSWTLVTGDKRTVESLLRSLSEFTPDKLSHSATVLIGRGDGKWIRTSGLGAPEKIVDLLVPRE